MRKWAEAIPGVLPSCGIFCSMRALELLNKPPLQHREACGNAPAPCSAPPRRHSTSCTRMSSPWDQCRQASTASTSAQRSSVGAVLASEQSVSGRLAELRHEGR